MTFQVSFFPYHIGCRTHFFQSLPIRRLISCHKKVLATTDRCKQRWSRAFNRTAINLRRTGYRLLSRLQNDLRGHVFLLRFAIFLKFLFPFFEHFIAKFTLHSHRLRFPSFPIRWSNMIERIIALYSRQFPSIQASPIPSTPAQVFLTAGSRCRRPLASCRAMSLDKGEEEEARNVDEEAIRSRDPGRAPRVHR